MALSDIVSISITTESAKVERAGFGVPMVLAADAPGGFTERVRYYTDITGLVTDFAVTTATYKQASLIFSQNPRPPRIAVGRLALPPTQRFAVTPIAANSTVYSMKVDGNTVSFTSDASATVTEIIAGLKIAIDALALPITVTDQTTYMRIVANSAGAFFSVESLDLTKIGVVQDHADPGLATDLAAIALEDSTWYAILCPFNSKAVVSAIAAWTETAKKLFIAQTQESDVVRLSNSSDTGGSQTVAGLLKATNYFRTALIYHPKTDAFADAAWAGVCLPMDPGSETWMFKTLAGVATTTLTATYRTNALAKYANVYETVAGVAITADGKVSGNEYIDVIRFRDWLEAGMSEEIFGALARSKKIPYTDEGIAVIEGIVRAQLQAGIDVGGLSNDPAPVVTVPLASSVSAGDKAARVLRNVKFDAVLAGAIHQVIVTGVIAV